MIIVNERIDLEQTPHGWTVWQSKPTANPRTGEPTVKRTPHYYGQLVHALSFILDREAGRDATTIEAALAAIDTARAEILAAFAKLPETAPKPSGDGLMVNHAE